MSTLTRTAAAELLAAEAAAAGIPDDTFDEQVHDVFDAIAADRNNAGDYGDPALAADPASDDVEVFGATHDLLSQDASDVNNGGFVAQFTCLLGEYASLDAGVAALRQAIHAAIPR